MLSDKERLMRKQARDARYYADHRVECLARMRSWRETNPEKAYARSRKWDTEHPEQAAEHKRRYAKRNHTTVVERAVRWNRENKERRNANVRQWSRWRKASDTSYRVLCNLRTRVYLALRAGHAKSARTLELVGCPLEKLIRLLTAQLRTGMAWENYGSVWHIDHIKPCAKFDLSDPEQQRACFHYSNLQPLFAGENLRKGAR